MEDTVYRHQIDIERLKADLIQRYGPLPQDVIDRIRALLMALDVESMAQLTQAEQFELLEKAGALLSKETYRQSQAFTADMQRLAAAEARWEAGALQATGLSGFADSIAATAEHAWLRARQVPVQATGKLLEAMIADMSEQAVAELEKEIRISIAQGRNLKTTVETVIGRKSADYRDGALERARRNTESIVRTATQHVSQQGRQATWIANDVDRWRFFATLDGKTSTQCRSLDQRTFPVGEGPQPPLHIRCRSTSIADLPDEGATRSSEDGYVAGDLTYYAWLKRQPAEYQDEILGPTRAKLLRDGGLTAEKFAALQLNKNFRPLTLEEMEKRAPEAFRRAGL